MVPYELPFLKSVLIFQKSRKSLVWAEVIDCEQNSNHLREYKPIIYL